MLNRKKHNQISRRLGAGLLLSLAAAGCDGEDVTPNPGPNMSAAMCGGQPAQAVSGDLKQDTKFTADKRWLLVGQVKVTNKATLTIEPGTTVCGDASDPMRVSYLNVDQDARLVADGSRDKPIVFTSSNPPGARRTSDWGGVVLRGRAQINRATPAPAARSRATPGRTGRAGR